MDKSSYEHGKQQAQRYLARHAAEPAVIADARKRLARGWPLADDGCQGHNYQRGYGDAIRAAG